MKILAKQLRAALSRVGVVQKTRTTLPVYSCVKLSPTDDDRLQLECTNGEAWTTRKVDCAGVITPILVNHAKLIGLLESAGDESVELKIDGANLRIKYGAVNRSLNTLDAAEFPSAPDDKGEPLVVNMEDLADGLEAVSWCAAKNSLTNMWKLCITVELSDKVLSCFASTGTRMALFSRGSICTPKSVMIPAERSDIIVQEMRETGAHAAVTDNMFFVRNNLGSATIKLTEAKSVPFRTVTDLRAKHAGTVLDVGFLQRNCRDALLLEDAKKMPAIEVKRKGYDVTITLKFTEEQGSETIEAPGEDLAMMLPALQVATALAKASTEKVTLVTFPHVAFIESGEVLFAFSQMVGV